MSETVLPLLENSRTRRARNLNAFSMTAGLVVFSMAAVIRLATDCGPTHSATNKYIS